MRQIISSGKRAALHCAGAAELEEVRAGVHRWDLLRNRFAGPVKNREILGGDVLKWLCLLPPPIELSRRGTAATDPFVEDLKHHYPLRITIRERLEQDRIDHRKDGRVAGYAHRQSSDGSDIKTGRPQEHAPGVFQLPQEGIHELLE
jgi:hypothetical protein